MVINQSIHGTVATLGLVGRLDGTTAKSVETSFINLVDRDFKLFVFDFTEIDYISSAGLRILLVAAKKLKTIDGRMVICCLTPNVQEVFDMSGFNTIFTIYDSFEDGLKHFE